MGSSEQRPSIPQSETAFQAPRRMGGARKPGPLNAVVRLGGAVVLAASAAFGAHFRPDSSIGLGPQPVAAAPRRDDPPPQVVPESPSSESGVAGMMDTAVRTPEYSRPFTPAESKIMDSSLEVKSEVIKINGVEFTVKSRVGNGAKTVITLPPTPSEQLQSLLTEATSKGITDFVFVTQQPDDKSINEIPNNISPSYTTEDGERYGTGRYATFRNGSELTFIHRQLATLNLNDAKHVGIVQQVTGEKIINAITTGGDRISIVEMTLEELHRAEEKVPYASEMIEETLIGSSK